MVASVHAHLTTRQRNVSVGLKTLLWWGGNIMFGLLPFLIVFFVKSCHITNKASQISNEELHHLLNDGVITFFCMALIGSIAVDIYSTRVNFKYHYSITMAIIGGSIGVIVGFVYLAFLLTNENHNHFGDFKPLTIGIVIVTFIYCSIGKISLILKEFKK